MRGWLHALREWWWEWDRNYQRRRRERRVRELQRERKEASEEDFFDYTDRMIWECRLREQAQKDRQRNKQLW